ncbi:MAG: HAD family hydrolase [Candidatus Omnitrophica bacterium]|nr:HAD family hydrolase [Candidatus Omnitrophota bacterium]
MIKAIIFDFDGVIAESVEVKTHAFRRLFEARYPEHLGEILSYHKINGGISRYAKFQYIYDHLLKRPLSESESAQLGDLFSQYVLEGVIHSAFVTGAAEFLEKYYKKLYLFIVSGTPEEEMRLIVNRRNLSRFFKNVYGSPRSKGSLVRMILNDHRIKQEEMVFIGDSINDYEGAQQAGVRFIGRIHPHEQNPFAGVDSRNIVKDIREFERVLLSEGLI